MQGPSGTAKKAEELLRQEFEDLQDIVIEEFQKRTPGYNDEHITNANEEGNYHEHSGDYDYTYDLVDSWMFTEGGTARSIAEVINISDHAPNVEFGQMRNGVDIHNGGHRMIASTLMHSPVRELYAQAASKALIGALATFSVSQRRQLKSTAAAGIGLAKDGASVYFRRGRVVIKGAVGSSVSNSTLKAMVENIGDQIADMLNAGASI